MNSLLLLILVIGATGLLLVVAPVVIDIYVRYRGGKFLNCPETLGAAEVTLKTHRAALAAAFGHPVLRVKSCSLWPKKDGLRGKVRQEKLAGPMKRSL
jgi:hypothetical protein